MLLFCLWMWGNIMNNILYERHYYLMKQTKKPVYLDFYELEDKDLKLLNIYLEQTVRYKNEWYFIEWKKKYYHNEENAKKAPEFMIKKLYKKEEPLLL